LGPAFLLAAAVQSIDIRVGVDVDCAAGLRLVVGSRFCQSDSVTALEQGLRGSDLPDSGIENAGEKAIS
jgi:hypothetical protein